MRSIVILTCLTLISAAKADKFKLKERGNINFYNVRKPIHFEIDLISYYENTTVIANLTEQLQALCYDIYDMSECNTFDIGYKRDNETITNELRLIQSHVSNRKKRWIWSFVASGLKTLGKYIIADLAISAVTWVAEEIILGGNVDVKTIAVNAIKDVLKIEKLFVNYANETRKYQEINEAKHKKYGEIRKALSSCKLEHRLSTNKIMYTIHDDVRMNFFKIFSYEQLKNSTEKEIAMLPANLM